MTIIDDGYRGAFRACGIANRVVIIHDMPDQQVISELEAADARELMRQIQVVLDGGMGVCV